MLSPEPVQRGETHAVLHYLVDFGLVLQFVVRVRFLHFDRNLFVVVLGVDTQEHLGGGCLADFVPALVALIEGQLQFLELCD